MQAEQQPFGVIYADPPWEYRRKVTGHNGQGAALLKYPTLSMDELKAFPLPPVADNAWLWMWVTNPVLIEGGHADLIRAWGFKPHGMMTWVKPNGFGMGYTLRSATEHCIVARRGKPQPLNRSTRTFFNHPRLPHSEKPEQMRKIIERICAGPYVELFARRRALGWTCYGNQLPPEAAVAA